MRAYPNPILRLARTVKQHVSAHSHFDDLFVRQLHAMADDNLQSVARALAESVNRRFD